jgi:hypothetical protein
MPNDLDTTLPNSDHVRISLDPILLQTHYNILLTRSTPKISPDCSHNGRKPRHISLRISVLIRERHRHHSKLTTLQQVPVKQVAAHICPLQLQDLLAPRLHTNPMDCLQGQNHAFL